ncbi:MAG: FAD-dependent oxidoreductase [Actinomycetota bacterium]|nr:MAG: FAD-dependent oxidoreductase [Actinomycetota bacterium]
MTTDQAPYGTSWWARHDAHRPASPAPSGGADSDSARSADPERGGPGDGPGSGVPRTENQELHGSSYDVVVAGAGIVGATTAQLLARRGLSVLLLDAGVVGTGVSGQATVKVTVGDGLRLRQIARSAGEAGAGQYADAVRTGLLNVAEHAVTFDCGAVFAPHDLWTTTPDGVAELRQLAGLAQRLGLDAREVHDASLPFPVAATVRYDDQLLLDPVRYLRALVAAAAALGAHVHEFTTVHAVTEGEPNLVRTSAGDVAARHVVIATHIPVLDRGLTFARVQQRRHYALAGHSEIAVGAGYDVSHGWSTRPDVDDDGRRVVIAVGPGHATGHGNGTAQQHRLRVWAERNFDVDVTHQWSTQDAFTPDGPPLVGPLHPFCDTVLMATGFGAWGWAAGAAAAEELCRRIVGEQRRWPVLDSRRSVLRRAPLATARLNVDAAVSLVVDAARLFTRRGTALSPGQGEVRRDGMVPVAVCRDREGVEHRLDARCTHLRCLVRWNDAEESWDCPCHGSRFAPDGTVRHGPAHRPLRPLDG